MFETVQKKGKRTTLLQENNNKLTNIVRKIYHITWQVLMSEKVPYEIRNNFRISERLLCYDASPYGLKESKDLTLHLL